MKILLVDDEPRNIRILQEILEDDYELLTAGMGEEAFEKACNAKPDLMLLDVMLPDIDGLEVTRRLKENEETRDIPVILLTAVGDAVPSTRYSHADGMATEADEYIPKPIDTEGLWEVVSSLL